MKRRSSVILGLSLVALLPFAAAAVMRRQQAPSSAGNAGEQLGGPKRRIVDITERAMPTRVTAVRNFDTADWIRDIEFEVENRSNRPIYYIDLVLTFPDVPETTELDGIPRGLSATLRYGRMEFTLHPGEIARPEDVPIKPGEKALLRLAPEKCESLKRYLRQHNLSDSMIKQVRVAIRNISFGDGSGYRSGSIPYFRRSTSNKNPPFVDRSGRMQLVNASYVPVQFGCEGQPWTTCGRMIEVQDNDCHGTCWEDHYYAASSWDPNAQCIGYIRASPRIPG